MTQPKSDDELIAIEMEYFHKRKNCLLKDIKKTQNLFCEKCFPQIRGSHISDNCKNTSSKPNLFSTFRTKENSLTRRNALLFIECFQQCTDVVVTNVLILSFCLCSRCVCLFFEDPGG